MNFQQSWQPDIIVGIDFGMTCTGVAYSMGPEWPEPKTIQHWPGKLGHELRNKVDTAVAYDLNTGGVKNWGFLCNPDDEGCEHNELFKLYLDPNYNDPSGIAPPIEHAQIWFRDYMQCLHKYINRHFDETVPRFESRKIEYVFSVPTTWKDPALINAMEGLIRSAGFGQKNREKASIYLTEAEAAAVYSMKRMDQNEVFLVCDAGGGTTDLNVLKVGSTTATKLELKPLSWTEGIAVGSTLIDYKAKRVLMERLRPVQEHIPGDLETVMTKIVDDQFRTFKCSFGVEGLNIPKLYLPIPDMAPGLSFPEAGIENSKLVLTTEELRAIFDEQVDKMFSLIDAQLQIVQSSHRHESISYLILSGGLSSSPYVQKRARARYENGGNLRMHNIASLKVLLAAEPQLAVCHGLVMARTQKVQGGPDVWSQRCCPISYGIVCRERYDPAKHSGEDVKNDDYEDKTWALNQISWIIRQGDIVQSAEGINQQYRHKIDFDKMSEVQRSTIVMSTLPAQRLPISMIKGGPNVKLVCRIEFNLEKRDMKLKNRHWYQFSPKYYRAEYTVKALVGAGLRFQIWGRTGQLSKDHDEIQVQWQPVDPVVAERLATRRRPEDSAMYRY